MVAGRPRSAIPEKEELIELGKDLVKWASENTTKEDPIRVRYCDWYTEQGFVQKQWEHMREKKEFQWYYEKARSLLGLRYVNGTVNQSIAHRYLRIYDAELRDSEDFDVKEKEARDLKIKLTLIEHQAKQEQAKLVSPYEDIHDLKHELMMLKDENRKLKELNADKP